MTLEQAIAGVRVLTETKLPDEQLARWISGMDGRILREDYLRAEVVEGYDALQDQKTILLIAAPWDELYTFWLLERIHFSRGEYEDAQNMADKWNELHSAFLANLLNRCGRDRFGRPKLWDLAFVRRGSDGVVHMRMFFDADEVQSVTLTLQQNEERVLEYDGTDSNVVYFGRELTLRLPARDTALLTGRSAKLVSVVQTVAGETYESDSVQIRVLDSALKVVE